MSADPSFPIGVGVIGAGRFGAHHVRAYVESPLARLIAIADIDRQRAEALAEIHGEVRAYQDYRELLDDPDVRAVSIATPAHIHAGPAIAAAEAGKHILLEKPIALTLTEAEAIAEAAARHGVKLMIGHPLRFETNFAAIRSAIEEGEMGRPLATVARFNNPVTEARAAAAIVSPVLHVMIHILDLALWYMERRPVRVFCAAAKGTVFEELGTPDGCVATIEFEGGGLAVTESFWCLPETFANWTAPRTWTPLVSDTQVEVICTGGVLYLGSPISSLRACDAAGWKFPQTTLRPTLHGEIGGAFREEIRHFLLCCAGRQEVLVDGHAAIKGLRVALAAEESLRSGYPVALATT